MPFDPVIAYSSYEEFARELAIHPPERLALHEPLRPHALFGWEFFVPEDTDISDEKLLREAVKLASRPDFRETRQSFHGWLKQMYDGQVAVEDARKNMLEMLAEYQAIMRGSGLKTVVRFVAKGATIVAPLASLWNAEAGTVLSFAAKGASLVVERLVPKPEPDERLRPAALVYDARQFFGKK